ncbi:hypothetical protein XENTR_v10008649 [Xenopus tropicalis]|nr:hypothetical protein XENTR_v10008649 [Xenopus tropicalis]
MNRTPFSRQNNKLDFPPSPCHHHLCHPPGMLLRMLLLPGGVARTEEKDWNIHLWRVQWGLNWRHVSW